VSFVFGQFELDPSTYKLFRAGREVSLQPKVFDAIRYLIENRDRVVDKEELLNAVWPGVHVNPTAVPWTISRARRVLGYGNNPNYPIQTLRGRGYRFTGAVHDVNDDRAVVLPLRPGPLSVMTPDFEHTPAAGADAPPSSVSLQSAASRALKDPFVGRAQVMEQLFGALHDASAGRGRLCLLTGEAGIGKTRCMKELAIVARPRNLTVWSGRCLDGGRTAVFWPWVQVVEDALGEGNTSAALQLEMRALLAELKPPLDPSASSSDGATASAPRRNQDLDVGASSAVAARFWMLEKLSRLLSRCAESAPRLILLDDVHWADEASLDLLVFLAAELSRMSVLVVATARNVAPLSTDAWCKALTRLGPCERIELSGLKHLDVEQYVFEVTGLELPPEIPQAVLSKSGGNPLFLQEIVRQLTAAGARDNAQELRREDIAVPGVARDVLRARLTGLAALTCKVLDCACVIGQEFELAVLQRALSIGAEPLLSALDEAVHARLVAPRPRGGTYGFSHDAIREALYEELPSAWRADLHCRVAGVLKDHAVGEFHVNDLAYHYYHALPHADPALVEHYTRLAGESAMRSFAYEDASRFYGWALEAQRFRADVDPRSSCSLLLALATAVRLTGRVADSRSAVARAISIARDNSFADLLLDAASKLRLSTSIALVPDLLARDALEDASRLLSRNQHSLRIRVLGQLACIPPYSLSIEESRKLSGRAVRLARKRGDTADLIEALKSRLHALSGPDDIDELLEVTGEIVRLRPESLGEVGWSRYLAFLHKGDIVRAQAFCEELGESARALRLREALWQYERACAQHAFHTGDFHRAESEFRELFVQSRRLRLSYGKVYFMMHTIALAFERHVLTTLPISPQEWRPELEWAASLPSFQAHQARFLLELGRPAEARRIFDAMAAPGFEGVTRDLGYLNTLANLSLVAVALGDRPRATQLYALMRPYPNHNTPNGFGFYQGSVSYFLGQLANLLGRPGHATAHLEDALVTNARLGFLPQLARTQLALAELIADEDGKSRLSRANALLTEAAATAMRLDMAPLTARVDRLRSRLAMGGNRSHGR
jgi:DNA-binding winged helix-turn-helix (wHTH) protein/tetratricopeptide (TPR) repeat protein